MGFIAMTTDKTSVCCRVLAFMDMLSPLTLENRLILACARTDPDVQRITEHLVERGPDWQAILRKVERWGVAPLVYTNWRQAARGSI